MVDLMPQALGRLPEIQQSVPTHLQPLFQEMMSVVLCNKAPNLNPREERNLRKDLKDLLDQHNVEKSRTISTDIVRAGFLSGWEVYLPLLAHEAGGDIARYIYSLAQMKVNLENINLAVDKTKKVVYALKSYAHSSEQNTRVPVSLKESIETVLTIYHNQLKYGVEVETQMEDVAEMYVFADELSQIWTNLIQNSIQAMQGEGKIQIRLKDEGKQVRIEFEDNGPGVPADIQDKIFEPFFTTKKRGEGTGLGLDICRKIVRKHGGDMTLESVPGRTVFTVLMPWADNSKEAAEQALLELETVAA
jgi:signal transduction histidine kinase